MTYALELNGKGTDKADTITLRVFKDLTEADKYISEFTCIEEKYWTRFVIVEDNETVNNLYRDYKESATC